MDKLAKEDKVIKKQKKKELFLIRKIENFQKVLRVT